MKLKFIVLKNYYDNVQNSVAVDLFSKVMSLKIKGYKRAYSYGVLPVSTVDFISDHLCLCIEKNGLYFPIISYRSTDFDLCNKFNINFPLFDLCKNSDSHTSYANEKIMSMRMQNRKIIYDSSLTYDFHMVKRLKINPEEHIRAMHTFYHNEILKDSHGTFAAGTVRFKMQRYYLFFGYEHFNIKGEKLPPVTAKFVENDDTELYFMDKLSEQALEQYRTISWDDVQVLENYEISEAA